MAEKGKKQYNLRSVSNSVQLPAQIHMNSDSDFLSKLAKNQQNSDADESHMSDLDCSAVVESSGDEQNPPTKNTHSTSSTSSTLPGVSALSDVAAQQAINLQILSQLSSISDRLNTLEKKGAMKDLDPKKEKSSSKKKASPQMAPVTVPPQQHATLNMPNLADIRNDALIQVDQRLKDLTNPDSTGTKIKSLRGGPVEVVVPNRVKWPQEFVLSGFKKERVQYDQLSVVQWVTGYCRILREEQNPQVKEHMIDYLIALMEDAHDFSWDVARASHAVLLCRMEQGEVKNYTETEKLDRIRRANAQRNTFSSTNDPQNSQKKTKGKVLNCSYYNQGTCVHQRSHDTKGVTYRHIYAFCFQQLGKTFNHSEPNCRNKNKKLSKNE